MKPTLFQWLVCPSCAGPFTQTAFVANEEEVVEGLLTCRCGQQYPIVDTIPRIMEDACALFPEFSQRHADRLRPRRPTPAARDPNADAIRRTRESFGYQWTLFSKMVIDFRENFLRYIHPLDESFFPGKVGIDVGCGFGRHLYNAAVFGAEMVGVDISAAIDVTRRNTRHLANVHLVQADVYHLPFRHGQFDFAYSIGVLHHLPDPEAGFRCLLPLLKPGGVVFIWVYSKSRPVVNLLLECARAVTTRLPRRAQKVMAFAAAVVDWVGFILPYKAGASLPVVGPLIRTAAFPRLKAYHAYPFQVVYADWFDRLAAPLRVYFDQPDLHGWLSRAQLGRPLITATGLYGWRAYGERLPRTRDLADVAIPGDGMKVVVLMPYLHDTVPGQRFRIEQWARVLEPLGVRFHFVPFESWELKQVWHADGHHGRKIRELVRGISRRMTLFETIHQSWDVVLIHRELLPVGPALLERFLARQGVPIVYDFDDAIFLPDVSDANRRFRWLKWPQKTAAICRLSTHTIVGNRYLQDYARRYTARVSVIPTTIDTDRYTPKGTVEIQGVPVIGWSGSLTTLKHLQMLEPTLKALRRSVAFRLKVIGSASVTMEGLEVESKPWDADSEVAQLQSFDLGIMPLPDDAWSRGKCGLKALQYMAVGVPAVASPVGVNTEIIEDGRNGFLASSQQEWVEKLSRLIADAELRAQFAREGRRTVEQWYSANVQAPRLFQILQQVCPRAAGSQTRARSMAETTVSREVSQSCA